MHVCKSCVKKPVTVAIKLKRRSPNEKTLKSLIHIYWHHQAQSQCAGTQRMQTAQVAQDSGPLLLLLVALHSPWREAHTLTHTTDIHQHRQPKARTIRAHERGVWCWHSDGCCVVMFKEGLSPVVSAVIGVLPARVRNAHLQPAHSQCAELGRPRRRRRCRWMREHVYSECICA